jgi:hypothetical protein
MDAQKKSISWKDEMDLQKAQNSKYESIILQKNEEIAQLKSQNQEYAKQIAVSGHLKSEKAGQSESSSEEKKQNKDLTEKIEKLQNQNEKLKKKYKVELIEEEKLVPGKEDLPEMSYDVFKSTYLESFTSKRKNLKVDKSFFFSVD